MEIESRSFCTEIRAQTHNDQTAIKGYAAVFNSLSHDLGGFKEIIAPGAFDSVLTNDVRALLNHDPDKILGRTTNGTLRIGTDAKGLWYEVDLPNTSYARDLAVSLERKDISESSFQFIVDKDEWAEKSGQHVRTITKVRQLLDVAPVVFAAYGQATVSKRALDFVQQHQSWQQESEARQRVLTLLSL